MPLFSGRLCAFRPPPSQLAELLPHSASAPNRIPPHPHTSLLLLHRPDFPATPGFWPPVLAWLNLPCPPPHHSVPLPLGLSLYQHSPCTTCIIRPLQLLALAALHFPTPAPISCEGVMPPPRIQFASFPPSTPYLSQLVMSSTQSWVNTESTESYRAAGQHWWSLKVHEPSMLGIKNVMLSYAAKQREHELTKLRPPPPCAMLLG